MPTLWEYVKDGKLPESVDRSPAMVQKLISTLKDAGKPLSYQEISDRTGYAVKSFHGALFQLQRYTGAVRIAQLYDRRIKDVQSLLEYPAVKRWQAQLKEGPSQRNSLYVFSNFLDYLREKTEFKTPDEAIQSALDASRRDLQKHVDIAKGFALSSKDGGDTTKEKRYNTVRSFYKANDCELPRSRLKITQVKETDLDLVQEESYNFIQMVRRAVNQSKCSILERAIVLVQFQSGIDDSTLSKVFNYLAYFQLCQHFKTENWRNWDPSNVPVLIHLRRPKTNKKFYTFLDRDAVEALKASLALRFSNTGKEIKIYDGVRKDKIPVSDPIFIVGNGKPVQPYYPSHVFRTLGFAAGINEKSSEQSEKYKGAKRRYLFHAHECRDSLVSLSQVKSNIVLGQFITAHEIDNLHYDKSPWKYPEHFKELYKSLAPFLNVVSSDPEKIVLEETLDKTSRDKEILENEYYVRGKRFEDNLKVKDHQISFLISELKAQRERLDAIEKAEKERLVGHTEKE